MNKLAVKYKAFTIHEMIVVLVIASLVISISILVLNLIQKQIHDLTAGYENKTEIRLLERALLNDFNSMEMSIEVTSNKLNGFSEISETRYEFLENYVVRNRDTFLVKIDEKHFYLDNRKVEFGPVDAMDLKIGRNKVFLYKQKAAAFYMNQLWHSK